MQYDFLLLMEDRTIIVLDEAFSEEHPIKIPVQKDIQRKKLKIHGKALHFQPFSEQCFFVLIFPIIGERSKKGEKKNRKKMSGAQG